MEARIRFFSSESMMNLTIPRILKSRKKIGKNRKFGTTHSSTFWMITREPLKPHKSTLVFRKSQKLSFQLVYVTCMYL